MAQKTNSFERFWRELKRRKVFGVVTTYAATAYIIIEIINNLAIQKRLSESEILEQVANIYDEVNLVIKAEEFYRKALHTEPSNPARMNSLAYFLIDNDISIEEGLELIDKALKLNPNDCYMLDSKGWGLYKKGKYIEALEFLKRGWDLYSFYDHRALLHLEVEKRAVANQNQVK